MSLLGTRPESGPKSLFITGELRHAGRANWAKKVISDALGPYTDRFVALDMNLFVHELPYIAPGVMGRMRRTHLADMVKRNPSGPESLLVIGNHIKPINEAVGYLLGRAVASEAVEKVFYMGRESTLGSLGSLAGGDITVINNPLDVYQWPAPIEEVAAAEASR